MQIAITSGKGGVGKTFIAVSLARVLSSSQKLTYIDCDVEAPNAFLFLKPENISEKISSVGCVESIDSRLCTHCGKCERACYFNAIAITKAASLVFPELCRWCKACISVCPAVAIKTAERQIGTLYSGQAENIYLNWAKLQTGAGGMTTRLIKKIKDKAASLTLLDTAPGTSCSVVTALEDVDIAVLVADPTRFGIHDLKLSHSLCLSLGLKPVVIINRASEGSPEQLRKWCIDNDAEVIGEIPEDRQIAQLYSKGLMPVDHMEHLQTAFENIAARLLEIKSARGNSQTPTNTEQIFLSPVKTFPQPARDKEKEAPAEIVIISGKGGTGKTSLSACFAQLAGKGCIDCDVDAADLHLLLEPQVRVSEDFAGSRVMNIDYDRCVGCGRCMLNCQFNAVYRRESDMWIEIDPALCEGCGTCMIVCELDAVRTRATYDGRWYHSQTRFGPMTHATLIPARENSGRLVSLLRQKAAESAAHSSGPSILDGSPGTGCPVIASITGAKAAVIVTEPTVSALADMLRVLDLTGHFNIPSAVVVNKCDINPEMTEEISRRADMHGAGVIGTLPFDKVFTQAQQEGKTILEYQPDSVMSERIKDIWIKADKLLNGKKENIQ